MSQAEELLSILEEKNKSSKSIRVLKDHKRRGLSSLSGYKRFFVETKSPTRTREGQGFCIKVFDFKFCHRHLLWHALYKGVSVLEWTVLMRKLELAKVGDSDFRNVLLYGVLSSTASTREGLRHWTSHTKPVHKKLRDLKPRKGSIFSSFHSLLDLIHSELSIPQKGVPVHDLYTVENSLIPRSTYTPVNFVGVGYKDKGSLSGSDDPVFYDPLVPEDIFQDSLSLSENWQHISAEFFPSSSVMPAKKASDEKGGTFETLRKWKIIFPNIPQFQGDTNEN